MAKFNVGDIVKVVKKVEPCYWAHEMEKMIGKNYKVSDVDNHGDIKIDTWWFNPKCLKLVKKTYETTQFKLNSKYTAVIHLKKKTVKVGCQTFTFAKIKELASKLN